MTASRLVLGVALMLGLLAAPYVAGGQTPGNVPRVGIIHFRGHHHVVVDGLRQGLRDLGLEEGKHFVLDIRETTHDLKAAEKAARDLERRKVDLIYAVTAGVAIEVKRGAAQTPIVFYAGADPVASGLVESLAKPGGRLTGVHGLSRDLTAKRLEILKEMIPRLRQVVTFYNPGEAVTTENARLGREAARQLGVQLVERRVGSVEELRLGLQGLRSGEVQAYFHTPGAMVTSQALLIIDATRVKRLPTMFHETSLVVDGALASYGHNYREVGRLSAKHVQRILAGAHPKDLPVENYDKVELALNLRTAREIGVMIPPSVRIRADKVIE
ncbi:MAG TPA: ABC transporter substrate-binding protein [Methylomirabilota bacterium]|jgi:putative ABC transport system substrate-binding protein|nr:ABC transporter substrate-binding protein [Methylomirabilota bacterium]